ncbi:Crp/Fnr family transcriptional regulator [Acinetobacter puyangensis]|uniref:Crp/Fnr family transcriptional regulator n=1 Tax=Acinetobacter puyangensis TaxID=1096779 RepID=UPI003A4E3BA1
MLKNISQPSTYPSTIYYPVDPNPSHRFSYAENYKDLAKNYFLEYAFFQSLNTEEKNTIFKNIKIKHFNHNHIIHTQNDICNELNLVIKGTIKINWLSYDGRSIIYKFLPSGFLFGFLAIISKQDLAHSHIAYGHTVIASIPSQVFLNVLKNNSAALYAVLELICQRNLLLFDDVYLQNTLSLRIRLARQLVFLIKYFSNETPGNIKLSIKLSQETLSELLNTSRQSINKELSWFSQEKILEVKYNQIYIIDYTQLHKIAKIT